MALSNVEKKVGVTVTVDATGALRAWKEYQRAQDQAKKSTEDMAKAHGVATKEMAAAIKHQEKLEKQAAAARKRATEEFKKRTDDNLMAVGRFTAGVGLAAVAIDELSQRQMEFANLSRNLMINIDDARVSTKGFISDMNLMKFANQSAAIGIADTSAEFANFSEAVQKLAARAGTNTEQMFNSMIAAVGRGSTEMLDNAGIVLKVDQAHELYAKQLGKTKKALTETEKAEAFRKIAMQKIMEAAEGVTLTTRGSAAEVQKFKVTLTNATDTALGWGSALGTEAVGAMSSFVNTVSLGTAGTTAFERAQADAMAVQDEYTKAVDRNSKAIQKWIDEMDRAAIAGATLAAVMQGSLDSITIEADRLAKVGFFQAQTEQRIAGQVHQLDLEEAKLKAIGGAEKDILGVQDARRALLMEEAALRGDILAVIEMTRQQEIASVGPARKGGKGDRFASQRAEFEAALADSQRQAAMSGLKRGDQTMGNLHAEDLGEAQNAQAMQAAARAMGDARLAEEQRTNDLMLEEKRRALEVAVAEGLDPLTAQAREASATVAFHERQLETLRQFKGREHEILAQEDALKQARHKAELTRIAAERRARDEALKRQQQIQGVVFSMSNDAMGLAQEVAASTAGSERQRTMVMQSFQASQATAIGVMETVKAAAAFASLNPVQGAMHTGAAALAFAKAGLLAGGVIGPGAGGGGSSGGGGSASFRPSGGGGSDSSRGASGQSAPISRAGQQHAPPTASGGGGFNGTVIFQSYLPADEEKMGVAIRRAIKHSSDSFGSTS